MKLVTLRPEVHSIFTITTQIYHIIFNIARGKYKSAEEKSPALFAYTQDMTIICSSAMLVLKNGCLFQSVIQHYTKDTA